MHFDTHAKYSRHIDYLVPSIIYLGTHTFWWARSPSSMGTELNLDPQRLAAVFDGFPAIFRRSKRVSERMEHYYALQARYAQRKGGDVDDPEQVSYIAPLDTAKLQLIINFVQQSAEQERSTRRAWITNSISISAAVLAATAAIFSAVWKANLPQALVPTWGCPPWSP